MKIIVEDGDGFTGLVPGTYTFLPQRVDLTYDTYPKTSRHLGRSRLVFTLEGELETERACAECGEHNGAHRPQCPVPMVAAAKAMAQRTTCAECSGTGLWVSPVSGKRSPCSRGCPCPST
jgi:hypothetical protein